LATRLRYFRPVSKSELLRLFPDHVVNKVWAKFKAFDAMGWVSVSNNGVQLTPKGCLILDELALQF